MTYTTHYTIDNYPKKMVGRNQEYAIAYSWYCEDCKEIQKGCVNAYSTKDLQNVQNTMEEHKKLHYILLHSNLSFEEKMVMMRLQGFCGVQATFVL